MKTNRKIYKRLFLLTILTVFAIGCKDTDDGTPPEVIEGVLLDQVLTLEFNNVVGDQAIVLSDQTYTNQSEEDYEVIELKYIISNIRLKQTDGTVFTYPVEDSYFVIDQEDKASLNINLSDIPNGRYAELNFGFGVDQNNYPIEQGTLNFVPTAEEKGMLWAWAAGYKFLKMEGSFRASGSDIIELFTYHIGSLSDTLDNYQEISLPLASSATDEVTTALTITADVAQIFDAVNTMSLEEKADVQIDPENSPKIAENIGKMFRIKETE